MHFGRLVTSACLAGTALSLKISKVASTDRDDTHTTANDYNQLSTVPLGDSITEITCWRAKIWDLLANANDVSNVTFVGSMTDNTQNCVATHADWDHHHEGHSGYLAINIANSNLPGWLASAKPDVVNFMLGTNDVAQGHSTSEITAAYTKMVQEMRASNPNMKIIVSLLF